MRKLILAPASLLLAGCLGAGNNGATSSTVPSPSGKPTAADADRFVQTANEYRRKNDEYLNAAGWIAQTYISEDAQLLSAKATEERVAFESKIALEAKRFDGMSGLSPATARALTIMKISPVMPSPADATKREELARILAKMEANYGASKWCRNNTAGQSECLTLQQIEKIVDNVDGKRTPDEMAAAWAGWHATAKPIRGDYQRFAQLMNEGSVELGFHDTGDLWRARYDMSSAEFTGEIERLWGQVKPLYDQLHCYTRARLNQKYGDALVPKDGLIPAHLLGNMWAQRWSNLYPLLEPYEGEASLDVSSTLSAQREAEYQALLSRFKGKPTPVDLANLAHQADGAQAAKMTRVAEDFYVSLGFPKLPDSFYKKSLLQQPRDRDVVCHASAWDMDQRGDVRIKQCIEPTEEQLRVIHHELGHIYYYLTYNDLPPLFQEGANDGFHEAIGDTITLSLTPEHLKKIGLVKSVKKSDHATVNAQMKLALEKIAFLPWSKLVDKWRWQVFDGSVPPANYNKAWWELRAQYQGVSPPMLRTEDDFDAGAKYHVAGNTPYARYFLAFVLQFQFQKALCDAAGFKGPLNECDIYGNAEAGKRYREMLALGSSQPWQLTLEKLTGTKKMDASALIDYFGPLMEYLKAQNTGRTCGWAGEAEPGASS